MVQNYLPEKNTNKMSIKLKKTGLVNFKHKIKNLSKDI